MTDDYLLWREVRDLARTYRVRAHGHFDGEPGAPDALAARRAMLVVRVAATRRSSPEPAAYILLRDGDNQPDERRCGLEQARREFSRDPSHAIRVVTGLANPKREAWILAGFEPEDHSEHARLASLQTGDEALGFDPREESHELYASDDAAKRSAKRVLDVLCEGDRERGRICLNAPLDTLKRRGASNGLADYLGEVEERLVPVIDRVDDT